MCTYLFNLLLNEMRMRPLQTIHLKTEIHLRLCHCVYPRIDSLTVPLWRLPNTVASDLRPGLRYPAQVRFHRYSRRTFPAWR